jgi:hypothetical protein
MMDGRLEENGVSGYFYCSEGLLKDKISPWELVEMTTGLLSK